MSFYELERTLIELEEVAKEKRNKKHNLCCIAYAISKGVEYFSINGVEKNENYYSLNNLTTKSELRIMIEDILGENIHFVDCKNSFTVLDPVLDINPNNKYYEEIYNNFSYLHKFDLTEKIYYKQYSFFPSKLNRYWTCAERKLYGMKGIDIDEIYVTIPPCYFCLPVIITAYFLDDNNWLCKIEKKGYNPYTYYNHWV